MGLGHAIWCARAFIGDDPFAILLPDDLMMCDVSCTAQLAAAYQETGGNVVAIEEVPRERVNRYGVLDVAEDKGRLVSVKGLVEKPPIDKAPSNLTVIGRYVLMPEVIGHLAKMEKGAGGEVQLTDGMAKLIGHQPFHGLRYEGKRFDCGDKAGYLEAQVAFALKRPDMAPAMQRDPQGLWLRACCPAGCRRPTATWPAMAGNPPDPAWPGGARLALSIVVNVEEGAELSIASGDERNESGPETAQLVAGRARPLHGNPLRLWLARRAVAGDGRARRATA